MSLPILKQRPASILLYWPNLVGYLRIVLLIAGLAIVLKAPLLGFFILLTSGLMDALDGFLARTLKQSSKFGAILDYALDRATVASFFVLLCIAYPTYWLLFNSLLSLDIMSHLFHLIASHAQKKKSHKEISQQEPLLLRLYYANRFNLTTTCLMHDLFLGFLFLHAYFPLLSVKLLALVMFPGFLFKTLIHIAKVIRSSHILIDAESYDEES